MSQTLKTRITSIIKTHQSNPTDKLPKIAKSYQSPCEVHVHSGKKMFVANNDAHARNTNNGYKRGDGGAFFCH